jgi:D-sedoheptulose 7-phosphate isomerase
MNYTFDKMLDEHNEVFSSFDEDFYRTLETICETIELAIRNDHLIVFMGNGGSATDAQHAAAEFVGKFKEMRKPYRAMAFSDNATTTAIANDMGFDKVFSRQIEAHVKRGDVVIGLSTSGKSMNVVNGIKEAGKLGATTISITGESHGPVSAFASQRLFIPSVCTARIQEVTIFVIHAIIEEVERRLS